MEPKRWPDRAWAATPATHPGWGIEWELCPKMLSPRVPPCSCPNLGRPPGGGNSLQAVALGPCEVHVAVQSPGEVLQGFFRHLDLPLGHEDALAREVAQSARAEQATGDRLAVAARRTRPARLASDLADPEVGLLPQPGPNLPGSILLSPAPRMPP